METRWIALNDIEIGERKRPIDPTHVARLAASIKEIGLQTPITVLSRWDGGNDEFGEGWRYHLVAGLHRLEAVRLNAGEGVECFILPDDQDAADLWEIDENLARAELTEAQRADHHVRREEILKRKELVSQGPGQPKKNGDKLSSYSDQAANSLGMDKRTVQRDLRRGKNIAPEVLAEVAGTDLDKGVVLDELARTPRDQQAAQVIQIRDRQETDKLNRYADKAVARSNAEEAADIIHANLDLDQVDALMARLASVKMSDFLAAMNMARAA